MPQSPATPPRALGPKGDIAAVELAADGGNPVRQDPMPPWPFFDDQVIERTAAVLRSGRVNYWTGDEGRQFEKELAEATGAKHAVALANGTVALDAALTALNIGRGDEVITTSRTFVASASSAAMLGATPVFADVDRESQNITAESVEAVMTPRTRAIVAVHIAGWPCEMDSLTALARSRGVAVVEDCAQAHGATHRGRPVGSLGDIAAWSFCQDKIITTGGEGGAITTNNPALYDRVWSLKDHGKSYDAVYNREHPPGMRWVHESFGTNWRLTEMQSAMGRVFLARLDDWVSQRRAHADALTRAFRDHAALRVPVPPAHIGHAFYKYYVFLRPEALRDSWDRDRIMLAIRAEGIPCFTGTCSEVYLEKSFRDAGLAPAERLPVAKELGETSLMLLVHPTLTAADIDDTIEAVLKVLTAATR